MRLTSHIVIAVVSTAVALFSGCAPSGVRDPNASETGQTATSGLILQVDEGERRVRRASNFPFIIKVDRNNGASPDLVMGYEELPVGSVISPHRHLLADEIIFVHRGSGVATVGTLEAPIAEGATVYIPRNVRITLRNTGSTPMAIAFVFSKPGFEEYLRDVSVLEGQPRTQLSEAERNALREKHRSHTVYETR
jgi:oxalate decarboxylase/phosphoglucose isomerase-like protein (cupin superfamily)